MEQIPEGVNSRSYLILISSLTVLSCAIFTVLVVDPLWTWLDLHVPENSSTKIDFTQPVDSIFYVQNAELGYRWNISAKTSLWFHPLLASAIKVLPSFLPGNYRLWLISLISAFVALIVVYRYIGDISPLNLSPTALFLVPLLPGGLSLATGNAEFPCLLLTSLLALCIIEEWPPYMAAILGGLAMLVKPNALYMIPFLVVYLTAGIKSHRRIVVISSAAGIVSIIGTWLVWILYVDNQVGQIGAYWGVRQISSPPLTNGPFSFLENATRVIFFGPDYGERLKYAVALALPLVDMWLLLITRYRNEIHRGAILANILAMLVVTFATNNPNKIIVYVLTFPGHLAIGLLFLQQTFARNPDRRTEPIFERLIRHSAGGCYLAFSAVMEVFFLLGTPLGWYY